MAEKIRYAKTFICFYLALPLFIMLVLIGGGKYIEKAKVEIPSQNASLLISDIHLTQSAELSEEAKNPTGTFPITAKDLSQNYNILNTTEMKIDESTLMSYPLPHGNEEPLVLVVHTHATECYASEDRSFPTSASDGFYGYYTPLDKTRTENTDENVVAVGREFCSALAENGISALQCLTLHDKDDYNNAYANSRKSIKHYIESYPTIKYVIDIHRDSLGNEGETKIKTLSSIEGSAQVMLVAGCHGNGVVYPLWEENLAIALQYKKAMDKAYPSLSRPIYLRYSRYNLDLCKGSMLLEIGSCANTLEEAKKAARMAGECLASLLK